MPTFNQLVRKGRQTSVKKSTAPALQKSFNSLQKKTTDMSSPQKRGVCTCLLYTSNERHCSGGGDSHAGFPVCNG